MFYLKLHIILFIIEFDRDDAHIDILLWINSKRISILDNQCEKNQLRNK